MPVMSARFAINENRSKPRRTGIVTAFSADKAIVRFFHIGTLLAAAAVYGATLPPPGGRDVPLRLAFEPAGDTGAGAQFVARGRGFTALLGETGAVDIVAAGGETTVRMTLPGASPGRQPHVSDALPGKVNYVLGDDPQQWRTNVSTYGKVVYRDVYPGIDLVYYGSERELEYDFLVSPGASYERIGLAFDGGVDIRIEPTAAWFWQARAGRCGTRLRVPTRLCGVSAGGCARGMCRRRRAQWVSWWRTRIRPCRW
jgi:hypothetical protein